jgi:hypothetical protein
MLGELSARRRRRLWRVKKGLRGRLSPHSTPTLAEAPPLGHIAVRQAGQMAKQEPEIQEVDSQQSFENWLKAPPQSNHDHPNIAAILSEFG